MNGIQDKEFIQELITGDEDPDRSVKAIVSTLERNSSKVDKCALYSLFL